MLWSAGGSKVKLFLFFRLGGARYRPIRFRFAAVCYATGSVMGAITAFHRHPALFRNADISRTRSCQRGMASEEKLAASRFPTSVLKAVQPICVNMPILMRVTWYRTTTNLAKIVYEGFVFLAFTDNNPEIIMETTF